MKEETSQKLLKKVVEDYDNISDEFSKTRQYNWQEFEDFLPYIENGDQVTDLGCGNGRFNKYLEEKRKVSYLGIDNSKGLIATARKNNPGAKFIEGDILKIPLKDKSADVLVCIAAIHHIPSRELRKKALEEIHRTIKDHGTLIITAWNLFQAKYKKYIWKSRIRSLRTLGKYDPRDTLIPWSDSGVERYYYAFKPEELKKLLEEAGFKIMEEKHQRNFTFICQKS